MIRHLAFAILFINFIPYVIIGQGVAISEESADPDESAMLHLISSDKGFLLPRMNTEQRDLIDSPAEGLMLFNQDLNCIQINIGSPQIPSWTCADGSNCIPQPSDAYAGNNQLNISGNQTYLNAGSPISGESGLWEILSGEDGAFQDETNPATLFSGMQGETYTLRWTISNPCGSTYDEIIIGFN